jgi:hypothetical protein
LWNPNQNQQAAGFGSAFLLCLACSSSSQFNKQPLAETLSANKKPNNLPSSLLLKMRIDENFHLCFICFQLTNSASLTATGASVLDEKTRPLFSSLLKAHPVPIFAWRAP